jgi:hypothetical protein
VCKGGDSYDPGEGKIVLCQRVLQVLHVQCNTVLQCCIKCMLTCPAGC